MISLLSQARIAAGTINKMHEISPVWSSHMHINAMFVVPNMNAVGHHMIHPVSGFA